MKKQYAGFIGIYMFSYFCIGALFPLLGQYLKSIGFNGVQIGTITASATAAGIIAAPFWGAVYERRNCSRKLLYILYGAALILILMLSFITNYGLFLAVFIAAFFFESPIRPLNDAITLSSGHVFGKVRLWGSAGFALGVFLAGLIAERAGLITIFPMYSISMLLGLLFLVSIRPPKKDQCQAGSDSDVLAVTDLHEKGPAGSFGKLLANKRYVALVLSAFFMNGTMIANNTYFGFLYLEAGGTIAGIGMALLLMVSSEIPMMWLAEAIGRKISAEKLLLMVMILSAARFLWYGTTPSTLLLVSTFFIQGVNNGIFLIIAVKYIDRLVDKSILGSAITWYTAIGSNAGSIVCLFAGGLLVDHYSGAAVYLFYGLMNLAGVLIYVTCGLHKSKKNDGNEI